MNRQAWIDIDSEQQGKSKEIGFCDLSRTLSLFQEFDRYDRTSCPTSEELAAEGPTDPPFDHDHLSFDVCFGDKYPGSTKHSSCWVSVGALKPHGYTVFLTVPLYWMGLVRLPACQQYHAAKENVLTREQVVMVLKALFQMPEKTLAGWAKAQAYLEQSY